MGCAEQREKDAFFSFRNQYQMVSCIRSRNINAVEELFRKGFKPDFSMSSFQGNTPLHIAVGEGLRGICDVILRQEGVLVDAKNDYDMTPLMLAASKDFLEVAKLLLDQDPPANTRLYNKFSKTAKDYAQSDKMKKLLDMSEWELQF